MPRLTVLTLATAAALLLAGCGLLAPTSPAAPTVGRAIEAGTEPALVRVEPLAAPVATADRRIGSPGSFAERKAPAPDGRGRRQPRRRWPRRGAGIVERRSPDRQE
jgi:hypothetical protein